MKANINDWIYWNMTPQHKESLGVRFKTKVAAVLEHENAYGVFTTYGMDMIPFDSVDKIIRDGEVIFEKPTT